MPAQAKFDAERFAALMARFDICNPSELEALNAARAIRRAAVDANLRVIDALYRADVMQALDAVLNPVREEPQELRDAFAKIADLADALTTEREITATLRNELAAKPAVSMPVVRPDALVIDGGVVMVILVVAFGLLVVAMS